MLIVMAAMASGCTKIGGSSKHECVDLGLPSGTKWATCNVGANSPEEYGDHFAWGETQPKSNYEWLTYKHTMGTDVEMLKYCTNSGSGLNGYTDGLLYLEPEDDAAAANWGKKWRTPTYEQWMELHNYTTKTQTTQNGVEGILYTGGNGKSIFLPFAGIASKTRIIGQGEQGGYWTSLLHTELHSGSSDGAMIYMPMPDDFIEIEAARYKGLSVRPVRK